MKIKQDYLIILNASENLNEMDFFLVGYKWSKLPQETNKSKNHDLS